VPSRTSTASRTETNQAVATGDPDPGDAILDILMIENDIIIVE
jgi:hypothetical protein